MANVRTRFAPSPTGYMHVGNLRTALYTYLQARHNGGTFILRIEDTDQGRLVEGATDIIYNTLRATGLTWDEGPDIGGPVGPYVQSQRMGMFKQYAEQLVKAGKAYYCFCTEERLNDLHEQQKANGEMSHYDGHCRDLPQEEISAKLAAGVPYVIRQKIPAEGVTGFDDVVYGHIEVNNSELDDQILIKTDGMPTYNFANVVDDHTMNITHVVRGNEYLSSAPKYQRLYDAFGWESPVYIHLPLITDENHKKLSKRSGHASFEDLLEQVFLPEAIVNYIALLGWSPEDNREIFTLDELIRDFDYHRISKSPAVFDIVKLKWMNGEYLKAMDFDAFYEAAEPYLKKAITKDLDLRRIAEMVKTRIEIFPDIAEHVDFFETVPEYDISMYAHKKMKTSPESSLEVLKDILPRLEAQEDYSNDALYAMLCEYVKEKEYKNGYVMWPIRTAASGKQMTPCGATEILEILGKEESIARIEKAIEKLS